MFASVLAGYSLRGAASLSPAASGSDYVEPTSTLLLNEEQPEFRW